MRVRKRVDDDVVEELEPTLRDIYPSADGFGDLLLAASQDMARYHEEGALPHQLVDAFQTLAAGAQTDGGEPDEDDDEVCVSLTVSETEVHIQTEETHLHFGADGSVDIDETEE